MILQGPADLELIDEKLAVCREGRLRVFVPDPAKGFTISTPGFDAVDLGTEFAMNISSAGESEIHVIDGSVDLHEKGGDLVRQLKAGDGARQRGGPETLEDIPANGEPFVSRQQLLEMTGEHSQSRFQEWLRYRRKWIDDEATILYFDFEEHAPWDRELRSAAPSRPNGGIVGARWVSGRWPEKSALEFKRATDRVLLDVPGEWESVSFAAWIRVEGLDRRHNALFLADAWNRGEPHWQIGDEGQLVFAINSVGRMRTKPILGSASLGRWMHLAVTYDAVNQRISHYLDGLLVGEEETDHLNPIVIGEAQIGNWRPPNRPEKSAELRSFNGRLDEMLVLGRVMNPQEIEEHHYIGNPYR
ncbi:MAG: LamG-like jellyroll fold domain-containing protein [Verrucomicrobiota bacterium]